jgi:hypothetical protein
MKTPITDAAEVWFTHKYVPSEVSRRLELDRAALMEAVDTLTLVVGLTPIKGNLEALQESMDAARSALAAARENFPNA